MAWLEEVDDEDFVHSRKKDALWKDWGGGRVPPECLFNSEVCKGSVAGVLEWFRYCHRPKPKVRNPTAAKRELLVVLTDFMVKWVSNKRDLVCAQLGKMSLEHAIARGDLFAVMSIMMTAYNMLCNIRGELDALGSWAAAARQEPAGRSE